MFSRSQNGIRGVSLVTTVTERFTTYGSTMTPALMRPYIQIVQKRLPAPPLFHGIDMTAFAGVMLVFV